MKNSDFLAQITAKSPESTPILSNFTAFPSFLLENLNVLRQIQTQISQNPHYLDLPNCPYTPEIKAYFRQIFTSKPSDPRQLDQDIEEFFGDKLLYDRIIADSKRAYMNLANQMTQLEAGRNLEDAISYTKALTSLQERLLTIQEKAEGLKHIHEFKNIVLEIIATQLSPDQRTAIIQRIEETIKA